MENEMVERVVAAMKEASYVEGLTFEQERRHIARAVIEAMREPTEAMIDAMNDTAIDGPGYVSFYPSLHDCAVLFNAAIDAALSAVPTDKAKNKVLRMVTEIDPSELAVRLIERGCHMKRPFGLTGRAAWEQFEQAAASGSVPEYIVKDFEAMAHIAIAYFGECIEALQQPQ